MTNPTSNSFKKQTAAPSLEKKPSDHTAAYYGGTEIALSPLISNPADTTSVQSDASSKSWLSRLSTSRRSSLTMVINLTGAKKRVLGAGKRRGKNTGDRVLDTVIETEEEVLEKKPDGVRAAKAKEVGPRDLEVALGKVKEAARAAKARVVAPRDPEVASGKGKETATAAKAKEEAPLELEVAPGEIKHARVLAGVVGENPEFELVNDSSSVPTIHSKGHLSYGPRDVVPCTGPTKVPLIMPSSGQHFSNKNVEQRELLAAHSAILLSYEDDCREELVIVEEKPEEERESAESSLESSFERSFERSFGSAGQEGYPWLGCFRIGEESGRAEDETKDIPASFNSRLEDNENEEEERPVWLEWFKHQERSLSTEDTTVEYASFESDLQEQAMLGGCCAGCDEPQEEVKRIGSRLEPFVFL